MKPILEREASSTDEQIANKPSQHVGQADLPLPNSTTSGVMPVQPSERIQLIDILRGFALLGILLVNMELFHEHFLGYAYGLYPPTSSIDQLGRWFIAFFGEAKFYSTFAFLFGVGMAMQYSQATAKGVRFVPFYLRRLVTLLGFGLIHAYLIWVGDILMIYALLGTVTLFFFRNRSPKTLLVWTILFLVLPLLINAALFGLVETGRMTSEGQATVDAMFAEQTRLTTEMVAQADAVYSNGNFIEITRQRAQDMNSVYASWPFMLFNILAMLLLGFYAGKQRILQTVSDNLPFVRKVWLWGLIVGVIGNFVYVYFGHTTERSVPSVPLLISLTGQTFGAPALAFFYMSSIALLLQRAAWRPRLALLANVGRMAISNYLLQSLICTTLFYGYGFGLYGTIGVAIGILLTLVIYLLQIPLSAWWLSHFRFGPVEWVWRSLTYGRRQPMRV